uniref:Uncharacterized protein n=1 Tax=Anopheles dirus TaxID=7168 RepID=A0A182MXW8_9DIPT
MKSSRLRLLFPLLVWHSVAFSMARAGLASCNLTNPNCTWFCDTYAQNRSASGSFQTEFLTAIRYQPLEKKFSRLHSIFVLPGIRYDCLELSVRCAPSSTSTRLEALNRPNRKRMLQLQFRCDHFVVTYLAYYKRHDSCYELYLDQMTHLLWGRSLGCMTPFSRSYRLEGDGRRYLLVVLCHNVVLERTKDDIGYWLFVNKRNTPQENREIMQQQHLFDTERYQAPRDVGFISSDKRSCRCDIFERYIREIKRCNKPFLVNEYKESGRNETIACAHAGSSQLADDQAVKERLRWFVVKCLAISTCLGVVFYALYVQFERHMGLPVSNRSRSGAFHTEYLFPLRYHPLGDQYKHQHSIFLTPGIQYHCLQVSVQCLRPYHNGSSAAPVSVAPEITTHMLLLLFRCEHFVVKYLMYYTSPANCYVLAMDQLAHRLTGISVGCQIALTRPYMLFGDGDRYLLIQYCLRDVLSRKNGDQGYWLFVNKRNTPQQNQEILQQLALPAADFQSAIDVFSNTSVKASCRCDVFQRYIHAIRHCKKPFLKPYSEHQHEAGNVVSLMNDTKTSQQGTESPEGQMKDEKLHWFVTKLVVVCVGLGFTLCTLYMQFERHTVEILG